MRASGAPCAAITLCRHHPVPPSSCAAITLCRHHPMPPSPCDMPPAPGCTPLPTGPLLMAPTVGDMQERAAPPADWYMDMRFWCDGQGPFPLVESSTTCSDGCLHPSYGPELTRMKETGAAILATPYFLNNGHPGMAMMFPIFRGNVTATSPWEERQAAIIIGMAASEDFDRLAKSIILEVLRQGVEHSFEDYDHSLEVYDVTPTDGPRLLYGVGGLDVPQGDPLQVAKIIPPSNETMLQPQRHKSVQQINLTNTSRTYQLWCRFQGSDEAHSMTAVFLGVIIVVVAALLAAIGVSVTVNTRRLREKTISMAMLKEKAEVAERNKGVFIANTSHELRTPIFGMEGMLKHLDEGGLGEGQREDVGAAVEEAEKILRLVNAVLDVCKAEVGRLHLESLPFALRPWLSDVLHPYVQAAQERSLESCACGWVRFQSHGMWKRISLSVQCLGCYWCMPPVQEGGSEQEESEVRGGSEGKREREEGKEREEGEERVSVRGERVVGGGSRGERVCSELSEVRGGAASWGSGDEEQGEHRGEGSCDVVHGTRARDEDAGRGDCTVVEEGSEKRCVVLLTCEESSEYVRRGTKAFMQTRKHGGSGMSLHLCRQLVSLMGGSIGLISTEGHGTTLHVALPMPVAAAAAAAAAAATATATATATAAAAAADDGDSCPASANVSEPAATCAASSSTAGGETKGVETKSARDSLKELLQGKAILVVDDNLINRRVAASTLARYGAEVALAESGEAALRLLQACHSFRLVLMDLYMPGLDGFHTTARLRAFEAAAQTAEVGMQEGQGAEGEQGSEAVQVGQGAQGVQRMSAVGESGAESWRQHRRVHVVGHVSRRGQQCCRPCHGGWHGWICAEATQ
ncbi:unnamed protein product [Closterium sp. Yama58-4]|nr:unnamed protein product [Closterium sp. Yama58-4]